jgi:hypothetical protein
MHIKDLKGNQQQQLIKPSDAKRVPMGTTVPRWNACWGSTRLASWANGKGHFLAPPSWVPPSPASHSHSASRTQKKTTQRYDSAKEELLRFKIHILGYVLHTALALCRRRRRQQRCERYGSHAATGYASSRFERTLTMWKRVGWRNQR